MVWKNPMHWRFKQAIAIITVLAIFLIGFVAGRTTNLGTEESLVIDQENALKEGNIVISPQADFSPFWKAWNAINEKYVSANGTSTGITDQEKIWGAISGLVNSLGDPYSVFLPPDDSKIFNENVSGNFGGVGMEIGMRDSVLTVIAPLKGTPAERAGIQEGDQILEVDGNSTANFTIDEAVKTIRGEVGTEVILTLLRNGSSSPLEVSITRGVIQIPVIESELRTDNIFVIKLFSFSGTAPAMFRQELREFVLSGSDKLILDLRGNPGGFLEAAVDIASWFLPAGKTIVVEDFGGRRENVVHRSRGYDIFSEQLKMVILINEGSASASEIVAGALFEHGIARLVGSKTFGKGSVQELVKVTPDTSLKITVARWKTPKGQTISKGGITPEFEIAFTEKEIEAGEDPQLAKAVELLSNK